MRAARRIAHLVRRWRTSLDRSPLVPTDVDFVRRVLSPSEWELWSRMDIADRRHSLLVARRFGELVSGAIDADLAAALLHDVGKSVSSLSTSERVVATLVAPFARPRRFDAYYRHEEIGLELCRAAGSCDRTLSLLADPGHPLAEALRQADDL